MRDYLALFTYYIINYSFRIDIYTDTRGKVIKNVEVTAEPEGAHRAKGSFRILCIMQSLQSRDNNANCAVAYGAAALFNRTSRLSAPPRALYF